MTDLPPTWAKVQIGDVCDVVGGATPKTGVAEYWGGDVAWVTPDDMSKHDGKYIAGGARSLTRSGYDSCSATLMPEGTVLFTSRAPIGYVAIADRPVCTNQGFKSFIPPHGILSDYVYWYLRHATPQIRDMGSGTTFKEVSKKVAATIPLPIAPLAEQRRIVDAIEEHFTRIDAAEAQVRALRPMCEGQLLALLRDRLRGVDGESVPVNEVLTDSIGGVWGDPAGENEVDVDVFRVTEFRNDGTLVPDTAARRSVTEKQLQSRRLVTGDILLEKSGGGPTQPVGRVVRVPPHERTAIPTNFVQLIRPDPLRADAGFMFWVLWWWHASGKATGFQQATTNIRNLKTKDYLAEEVVLPGLEEQRALVCEFDEVASCVGHLSRELDRLAGKVSALRMAVLAEAFAARLVPQDPEDEPAQVLLDRIAEERAVQEPGARRGRQRKVAS